MLYMPLTGLKYPNRQNEHMITVSSKKDVHLSEDYPFRDSSFSFKFWQFWVRLLLRGLVLPATRVRYGLKIEGRVDKSIIRKGFITVCNHVCYWDFFIILCGFPGCNPEFPIWRKNMEAADSDLYKLVGGIPIPSRKVDGPLAYMRFMASLHDVLNEGRWLHFYPESSMWFYYVPIRPFRKTAFTLACEHDIPVIPLVIAFREPRGLYAILKKKEPLCTLHIGEPIYADKSLEPGAVDEDLLVRCREKMLRLAGIYTEEENERLMGLYKYSNE